MTPLEKYAPLIVKGYFIFYVTVYSENDLESEIYSFF